MKIPTIDQVVNESYDHRDGSVVHRLLVQRLVEREQFVLDALKKEKGEPTEFWMATDLGPLCCPFDEVNDPVEMELVVRNMAETHPEIVYFLCHGLS